VWQIVKKYEKQWYVVILVMIAAMVVFMKERDQEQSFSTIANVQSEEEAVTQEEKKEEQAQEQMASIFVDVKGAVVHQGVYEVKETARVKDVIAMAGGFTKEADQAKVNLAAKVHDEMMIYVPARGETNTPPLPLPNSSTSPEKQKIDINAASLEEIQQIHGIGPAKAAAIIAYREEHGPFRKIEDLLNVTGIGEKSLEKMKEQIIIR
jgi:competence protein ComEA